MDGGGINPGGEQVAIESAPGHTRLLPAAGDQAKDKKAAGLTGGFVDQNLGKLKPCAPAEPARLSIRDPEHTIVVATKRGPASGHFGIGKTSA